ncbi:hypothetical protein [Amphritea balenae]|uniref:DUF3405 domain-containing protein n=1 Tax=Amphritea balenae TaxID=452629 RepID=A0A3P1SV07_9GAMM|nr:hypothetical protein [Amphritea balenae]RRD00396.1 hypothetical protein EHS89_04700 [Amphritea balenae]GGK85794.1 hypothetical protein GCM10007941_40340 [Amphritea balenae]
MSKQCFLFQSHFMTPDVERLFRQLADETKELGDAFILYHLQDGNDDELLRRNPHYCFTDESIDAMNYRKLGEGLSPGATHFPVLKFNLDFEEYDYYWLIENDVQYSGSWNDFFRCFDENCADYLTSNIYPFASMPEWPWWELSHPDIEIPESKRFRSFNPVFRVSCRALTAMHILLRSGWLGHNEVAMPTLLHLAGLDIEDFGGEGPFVPKDRLHRFYSSSHANEYGRLNTGTYRFRPAFEQIGDLEGKLYHPVKLR